MNSVHSGMSDELVSELFRTLVLHALEGVDPQMLDTIFNAERDGSEQRILAGLKAHNDKRHSHYRNLAGISSRANRKSAPQPNPADAAPKDSRSLTQRANAVFFPKK